MNVPIETAPLTLDDFGIPRQRCFTPMELGRFLRKSAKTVQRMIRDGKLRAIYFGDGYVIPYSEVLRYFQSVQGVISDN
jgi:excisionase family DNA binding protein